MKKPRKQTANRGAAITRRQVIQHLQRELKKYRADTLSTESPSFGTLIEWIRTMPSRSGKRAGGLGRR